ncbi:4-hydroxybenzoate polyprenyltransferase [Haloplanus vescus]|uniref:4-hydroxybenzoate polyprenyltransferase n=1 Tax=Haloplanus vescus TaxID=555874 RepID=A0A1H4AQH4_9EURY|nr:decaprenyl-phosphate phosphoribosyltransferase [Haloplanus vescus]SEA38169.1 4-hydroxybenzoate polyprenyltransferase [Haloplanus vescus]
MYQSETGGIASQAKGLLWEMRPWQWYKQSMVLLGVTFSGRLFDVSAVVQSLLTVSAFSMVAGAVYVFNDISDVEQDRKHPEKRNRPIASGTVSIPTATIFGGFVGVVGLWLGYYVDVLVLAILLAYVLNNVFYNLGLKDVLFVDILIIAIGFVLRALAGVYAIQTDVGLPSPWLIVCTLLAALLLGLGKRYQELKHPESDDTRTSLERYDIQVIDRLLVVVISTLLMAYSLYTFNGGNQLMMLTLPFAYFATFRFYHLIYLDDEARTVERMILFDRSFIVNLALWVAAILIAIYLRQLFVGVLG